MRSRTLLNLALLAVVALLILVAVLEPGKEAPPAKVQLTELKQTDITHILIQRDSGDDIELEKVANHWWLRKPYNLPANTFRADSAARLASEESYSQHALVPSDTGKYQLDKPGLRVTFNQAITVKLGGTAPLQQRRYAQVADTLHTINDSYNYSLAADATAFVSYALLPPQSRLTRLELPDFSLRQHEGTWQARPAQKLQSGDDLNEMITYWENAQSLEVFALADKAPKGKRIRVGLAGQEQPIEFILQKTAGETSLLRADLGIGYKLSQDTAEQLLSLPPPKPAATDTASPAATK